MPEKNNLVRKFRIKIDKAWSWHLGLFFCVEPKTIQGTRDHYLFIALGKIDISIGVISEFIEDEDYE